MKTILSSFVVMGLALFVAAFYAGQTAVEPAASLRTAKVKRGDLSRTINAKGTVKLEQVEVGAQVTGMIAAFGCDVADPGKPLDCGSHVSKGEVLARIDPTIYQAQVDYAEASLLVAKANLSQYRAKRNQTEQEWKRAESLRPVNAIADSDYDLALTNFQMATANVAVGEAAVQESEATLRIAKTNFDYTIIKSPCDGVILDRRVNVGQTVVAATEAPGLFFIAKDSRQMQVWASVNEADIGRICKGMEVQFTVNACVDKLFEGKVAQVRMSPTGSQDAITYTVVIVADHLGNMLPGMTANLQLIERRPNVLLIPNNALKRPPRLPETVSKIRTTATDASSEGEVGNAFSQAGLLLARKAAQLWKEQKVNRRLWVKDGGLVRPIEVQIGVSNGLMTEIMGGNVEEGMEVVVEDVCMKDDG